MESKQNHFISKIFNYTNPTPKQKHSEIAPKSLKDYDTCGEKFIIVVIVVVKVIVILWLRLSFTVIVVVVTVIVILWCK